jgi:hypothetical protein
MGDKTSSSETNKQQFLCRGLCFLIVILVASLYATISGDREYLLHPANIYCISHSRRFGNRVKRLTLVTSSASLMPLKVQLKYTITLLELRELFASAYDSICIATNGFSDACWESEVALTGQ